jgi:hypothetical protein
MKTNHRRDFKDTGSFRQPEYLGGCRKLSDRYVQAGAVGHSFARGHRGAARAKHGAKQFLRSRERKDGKIQCVVEIQDLGL